MTVRDVIVFLKKYTVVILATSLAAGGLALLVSLRLPVSYEAVQTIFIKRQASAESKTFYTYDGYYSAQAAERFTDSAFGALKSRDFLKLIVNQIEPEDGSLGRISKDVRAIKVRRLSPQLISLSYAHPDQQRASRLVQSLSKTASDLMLSLNRGGDEGIAISFVSDQPIVTPHRLRPLLSLVAGGLLGLFISLIFSGSHYFIKNLPK